MSGGQAGVDRATLNVGLALNIPVGGWCPQGRRAEDGIIHARYPLVETPERNYPIHTRRNIEDSDRTLILNLGNPMGHAEAIFPGIRRSWPVRSDPPDRR